MLPLVRHRRQIKRRRIIAWPANATPPEELASLVSYVGSAEHKDHPSPAGPPRLRSDASRCDPRYLDFRAPTEALQEAIRAQRTSEFQGQFPIYVWGALHGKLYEARLVNHVQGQYKAYPIEMEELPEDPHGLLDPIRS
jgi:hypothetical protein